MKRASAKKFLLIYKDIPIEISNDKIITILKKNIRNINDLIISEQKIENNFKKVSIYLESLKKFRFNLNLLNIKINNKNFYPEIITGFYKEEMIETLNKNKSENSIEKINTNFILKDNQINENKLVNYLIELAYQKTPEEIERILLEKYPLIFVKKGQQFLKNLQTLSKHHNMEKDVVKTEYDLKSYTKVPKYVLNWLENPEGKSLIIKGISNTGKTHFALALLKDYNPLLVGDKEKLKEFKKGFHKSIIFDNFDFDHISREEVIKYFDMELDRDFRVTYGYITIPRQIKKIFTTNKDKITKFDNFKDIQCRILNFEVKKPLFPKKKSTIQIDSLKEKKSKIENDYKELGKTNINDNSFFED
jgi:serine kinase of HPr protein (carbohydrate metabolism regulator)